MDAPTRRFKDAVYEQFARVGKALSNPHRIEILELLAQSERAVDSLAGEIGLSLANTSQHLQALRQASLVETRARLHASLHDKLLTLPEDLEIYPGHFSGSVCGVGLSGKPTSTIGFERRWNPLLSLARDAFVDAQADVPEKPAEMERILAANRGVTRDTRV